MTINIDAPPRFKYYCHDCKFATNQEHGAKVHSEEKHHYVDSVIRK